MDRMKVLVKNIIDFPKGDLEGNIAREKYKTCDHVLEFVELMKNGVKFPPLEISKNNFLLDGMHRLTAYKLLGIKEIDIFYGK